MAPQAAAVAVAMLLPATLLAAPPPADANDLTLEDLQAQLARAFPQFANREDALWLEFHGRQRDTAGSPYAIVEREPLHEKADAEPAGWAFPTRRRIAEHPAPLIRAHAACVRVMAGRWHGAGVLVSPDGHVLTSFHLLAGAPLATVQTLDGKLHPVSEVLAYSHVHDLALVRIDGGPFPFLQPREGPGPGPDEPLFVIGHPRRFAWIMAPGRAIRHQRAGGTRLLHFDAAITRGTSGGPVVDAGGRLCAVTAYAARLADGSRVKVGIAAEAIRGFLAAPAHPPASFRDLAAFQRYLRTVGFLEDLYGIGEVFIHELKTAMAGVQVTGAGPAVPLPDAPDAPARFEFVLLRHLQPCDSAALKLLMLRVLTQRCFAGYRPDHRLVASAHAFDAALAHLIRCATALERAHGRPLAEAAALLDPLQAYCREAEASFGRALTDLQDEARQYDRELTHPERFTYLENLRRKYAM
jgi:S1-C subfamily serine protease